MNSEPQSLRIWLEGVSPGAAAHNDGKYHLVRKLVAHYGATPSSLDTLYHLLRKLTTVVGATFAERDTENGLWKKIAEVLGANPKQGDSTPMILSRIAASDSLGYIGFAVWHFATSLPPGAGAFIDIPVTSAELGDSVEFIPPAPSSGPGIVFDVSILSAGVVRVTATNTTPDQTILPGDQTVRVLVTPA